LAAFRTSAAVYGLHLPRMLKHGLPADFPAFNIANRDGSLIKACSYAYPETQKYVIDYLTRLARLGYDGVTLIMHRGAHVGFEKPVLERFKKLYPAVDPLRLPVADPRLHGVWCNIMTEFVRGLRASLDAVSDKRLTINVIGDYGLQSAKYLGLDFERWAKEGLIDSVCQADMETVEDLTDCMSDTEAGLIDWDKYKKQLNERQIIRRSFATDIDKVCKFIPEYKALKNKYGVEVYHVLPWCNTIPYTEIEPSAERMRKAGAEKFLHWNTNHTVPDKPEWYTVSHLGRGLNENIPLLNLMQNEECKIRGRREPGSASLHSFQS
jgi:hypothetical protein